MMLQTPVKIAAGLGRIDDYTAFAENGADEVFIGYVPENWARAYGLAVPLNRREIRMAHAQIGGENDLCILSDMRARTDIPCTVCVNSSHYLPSQYPGIAKIITGLAEQGFTSLIVSDMALLVFLRQEGIKGLDIHLSGEVGQINREWIPVLAELGVTRVIFHRKMCLEDMRSFIASANGVIREFEAFALNELCHFDGGYCNTLHGDELCPACHLPWRLGSMDGHGQYVPRPIPSTDLPGATGCGLCALHDLQKAGVTHVKLVGRGCAGDQMIRDIRFLKAAVNAAAAAESREDFHRALRGLFPQGCGGRCYYPELADQVLLRSCQNAMAPAAATLSESTPGAIGI